jgi:acyl carrier protein
MELEFLITSLNKIFTEVLDADVPIELKAATVADDVDGWDSLTHIQLVVSIEKNFGCRFTSKEIQSWKNVGEMIACIQSKQH